MNWSLAESYQRLLPVENFVIFCQTVRHYIPEDVLHSHCGWDLRSVGEESITVSQYSGRWEMYVLPYHKITEWMDICRFFLSPYAKWRKIHFMSRWLKHAASSVSWLFTVHYITFESFETKLGVRSLSYFFPFIFNFKTRTGVALQAGLSGVRIPVGARGSSRLENVQTGSGAHPASY
jgi:hypothetical protein